MKLVRDAQETCVTPDATAGEEEEKETVQFRPLLLAARSELTDGSAQKALQMFQEIELKARLLSRRRPDPPPPHSRRGRAPRAHDPDGA